MARGWAAARGRPLSRVAMKVMAPRRPLPTVRIVLWLSKIVLVGVFIYAAIPKINDPRGFAELIYRYQILPGLLVNVTAIYLPWLELVAAVSLLVPKVREAAGLMVLCLLAIFTAAVGVSLYRGLNISCGCFSTDSQVGAIGGVTIVRNLFLILMAGMVYLADTAPPKESERAVH